MLPLQWPCHKVTGQLSFDISDGRGPAEKPWMQNCEIYCEGKFKKIPEYIKTKLEYISTWSQLLVET